MRAWTFALLPELLISRQLVATSVERQAGRQAGRRHYLLRVRVREGECPPHRITMATPVRPATASCPACFHVLLAWRLLTSQTPLSTITYKTSSFFHLFFHFFSLSSSKKKSVYSGQMRFRPSSLWQSFREKRGEASSQDTEGRSYLDANQSSLQSSSSARLYIYISTGCRYTRINIEYLEMTIHVIGVKNLDIFISRNMDRSINSLYIVLSVKILSCPQEAQPKCV